MNSESQSDRSGYLWVRLDGDRLVFIASTGRGPDQVITGSVSGVRDLLQWSRLTEAGLEVAITQVEDLIMPMLRSLPESAALKVTGSEFTKVLHLLPANNDLAVSIESVEALFNKLAAYAGGSPVAWLQDSLSSGDVLGLVVLREVMHHGGFNAVLLLHSAE